jgi:hypothetical protein
MSSRMARSREEHGANSAVLAIGGIAKNKVVAKRALKNTAKIQTFLFIEFPTFFWQTGDY